MESNVLEEGIEPRPWKGAGSFQMFLEIILITESTSRMTGEASAMRQWVWAILEWVS